MADLLTCSSTFRPELCGVNLLVDPVTKVRDEGECVLILGQDDPSSSIPTGTTSRLSDVEDLLVVGSPLWQSVQEFQELAPTADIYVGPITPIGSKDTWVVSFELDPNATEQGVAHLWVNGQYYSQVYDVIPTPTTGANQLRLDLMAQLQANGEDNLEIIPTSVGGVPAFIIRSLTGGEVDGFVDVRTSYDRQPNRVNPSDLTITATKTNTRSGTPDLSPFEAMAARFSFVDNPYTDSASRSSMDKYACSQWAGGKNAKVYGVHYGADEAENITFAKAANSGLLSYIGMSDMLTPSYVESASFTALAYNHLKCDSPSISASMTGTVMPNTLAPEIADTQTDENVFADMVNGGIGYVTVNEIGQVVIGRAVTTYTTTPSGQTDVSLQNINTPAQLACVSRDFRTQLTALTTGTAYRQDGVVGTNLSGNAPVLTDAAIRNLLAARAEVLSGNNIIQDVAGFIKSITFTREANGCIRVESDPKLVEQFCCLNVVLRAS